MASGRGKGRRVHKPLDPERDGLRRTEERRSFIFFAVVMAPLLTVIGIAAYGFAVWMYQTFIGGPPGT